MLPVERISELLLDHEAGVDHSKHVQAASGLAIIDRTLYVVADTETYLAIFPDMGQSKGRTIRLLDVELPDDPEERKKRKPDLESLTPMGAFGSFTHGGILALGSGSKEGRGRGAFAALAEDGSVSFTVQLDASPLMKELADRIPKLNLEGTAVAGDAMRILQRGNKKGAWNAHIDLDLDALKNAIEDRRPLTGKLIGSIVQHDLGRLQGTKLGFSDAHTLTDGRIVFSASAEQDEDSEDGVLVGSAIGMMSSNGEVLSIEPIDAQEKVEGLAAVQVDGDIHAYMVTDDDDPSRPTALLRVTLPA